MSRFCNQCGKTLADGEVCTCALGAQPQYGQQAPPQGQYGQQMPPQQPYGQQMPPQPGEPQQVQYVAQITLDPYDHTAEFSPKDISDNKVIAMLVYMMGIIGVIVALLASSSSPYVAFHLRQELKIIITSALMGTITVLLAWTLIVPIAFFVMSVVISIIQIICFFQVCSGKAKEPAIIRGLSFLK